MPPATYSITHNFDLQNLGGSLLPQANEPKSDCFNGGAAIGIAPRRQMDRSKRMSAGKGSDEAEQLKVG